MTALDTNILARFLTDDAPGQAERAAAILAEAERTGEPCFVSIAVVLEIVWLLDYVYKRTRAQILDALESLLLLKSLRFEHENRIQRLTTLGRETSLDLADILIGLSARDNGCQFTWTFDKKAARSELFKAAE